MIPLVGCKVIVEKHFSTLSKDASRFWILILFFLIPAIFSYIFIGYGILLTQTSTNALMTGFAIFSGLLFNVILLLYMIVDRASTETTTDSGKKRKNLLEHLYANSIYALLMACFILILLMFLIVLDIWSNLMIWNWYFLLCILSFAIYFGVGHFAMNLLMIFKRLFVLLFGEFNKDLAYSK